ncbi:MAG TPA: hypothetical protein VE932_01905 [Patescibacteria group bacterium]|nr:hypothetical protein [Patescibacteria group bacterium]
MSSPRPAPIVVVLVASLLVYAGVAVTRHWWPSGVVAPLVAALLWRRHRRARFTAYVFFSVLAARGALTGAWALPVYALAAVGLLQMPAARAAWPRLTLGRARGDTPARDDRMRRS